LNAKKRFLGTPKCAFFYLRFYILTPQYFGELTIEPYLWLSFSYNIKIKSMEKVVRIVKKGEDESNINYWMSISYNERLQQLELMRQEINKQLYGTRQGFQRIYRVIKRA
jgi:hypothetical protein